jgi:spore coat protein JB
MDRNHMNLLKEIMEIGFVLVETGLYLDTHPDDKRVLGIHNSYSQKYTELVALYNSQYGPLKYTDMSRYPYSYALTIWPWDIDYNNF